jgi:hypothetical protein
MIGDSMLHGLAVRFNDYCLEQGYDFDGLFGIARQQNIGRKKIL